MAGKQLLEELAKIAGGDLRELEREIRRIAERDLKRQQRREARKLAELHDDDYDELDEEDL